MHQLHWKDFATRIFESMGVTVGFPTPILFATLLLLLNIGFIFPALYFISFTERKITADLQARVGPNRVGLVGFFQGIFDTLKLFQKTKPNFQGDKKNRLKQGYFLLVIFSSVFAAHSAVSYGQGFQWLDTENAIFLSLFSLIFSNIAVYFSGVLSHKTSNIVSSGRAFAQTYVAILPVFFVVFSVAVNSSGFSWSQLYVSQSSSLWDWNIFSNPFILLSMPVYYISGLIFLGMKPFGSPYSQMDLKGGLEGQYSGNDLIIFKLTRSISYLTWLTIGTWLFFGGWSFPGLPYDGLDTFILYPLQTIIILGKTFFVALMLLFITTALPQLRSDQAAKLIWKVLIPISVLSLAGTAIFMNLKTMWGLD